MKPLPTHLYTQKVSAYVYKRGKTRRLSVMHGEVVVGHADSLILRNVRFRVQDGVRQWCIEKGRKKPHAFVDGQLMQCSLHQWEIESTEGIQVSYDRHYAGYFFDETTGEPIYKARVAVVTPWGSLAFV